MRVGQNARDFQHHTSMPFSYANIYNHVEKTFFPSHLHLVLSSQSLFLYFYIIYIVPNIHSLSLHATIMQSFEQTSVYFFLLYRKMYNDVVTSECFLFKNICNIVKNLSRIFTKLCRLLKWLKKLKKNNGTLILIL